MTAVKETVIILKQKFFNSFLWLRYEIALLRNKNVLVHINTTFIA